VHLDFSAWGLWEELSMPVDKYLVTKFEFGGKFGMILKGDCHEVEVTPYLKLLVTFSMSL
jgi:hypothetical protein